jgi:hypothetical protein
MHATRTRLLTMTPWLAARVAVRRPILMA